MAASNLTGFDPSMLGCLDESLLSSFSINFTMDMSNTSDFGGGFGMPCGTGAGSGGSTYNAPEFEALREPAIAAAVIAVYVIIIIIGAIGNSMVVLTVIRTSALWNATNIFIANLAVADILVCVLDMPVSLYYQLTDDWAFGKVLCHVLPCVLGVVVYASALTLMLIAVDRYLLICCPTKQRVSVKMALLLVVILSIVSLAVTSPLAIYSSYVTMDDNVLSLHLRYCTEAWPQPFYRRLYSVLGLMFQYVLPVIVIAILYILIFKRLQQRIQGSSNRRTKTTKMLVAVVTLFAVAWTPFHVFALVGEFYYSSIKGRYFRLMDVLCRCFAMSSSCINPILYGWFNDNYKNAFIAMVKPKGRRTKGKHVAIPQTGAAQRTVQSPQTPARNNKISTHTNGKMTDQDNTEITSAANIKHEDVPMTAIRESMTPEATGGGPEATPLINDNK